MGKCLVLKNHFDDNKKNYPLFKLYEIIILILSCIYERLNFVVVVLICVQLFVTPWTAACPWDFPRQRKWVAISFAGDLPDTGIDTKSHASPALAGRLFYYCATREALLGIATR